MREPKTVESAGQTCDPLRQDGRTETQRHLSGLMGRLEQEIQGYAEYHIDRLKRQVRIGLALSSERDIGKLLDMIVSEARHLTHADAGTLYIRSACGNHLDFHIIHNDTMGLHKRIQPEDQASFPPVQLSVDGRPNHANVSSHVALTGKLVNIRDVYQVQGFDFTGPRRYDAATGYRSTSMLVVPLTDHEGRCIGVLQLLNAKDPDTGEVGPFHEEYEEMAASLASQAAVALTSARLIAGLEELFSSFIKSIAKAIDCKSPYTGGHIKRVVTLAMLMAQEVNESRTGTFARAAFSADELEELRLAAWLHDVGKIATPEHVIDKRTKLETVFDRAECVAMRFDLAAKSLEADILRKRLALYESGVTDPQAQAALEEQLAHGRRALEDDKRFVLGLNSPEARLDQGVLDRLGDIRGRSFEHEGEQLALLTEDEAENLRIPRGTLNDREREKVQGHALLTEHILREINFPAKYGQVPVIAGSHHEHLNGKGYPYGRQQEDIPLQARILTIADIFEALTAKDRPYKRSMSVEQALAILERMKDEGSIDAELFELFRQSGVIARYLESDPGGWDETS